MANVLNLLSESTYIEQMEMQNALLKAIATQSGKAPTVEISSWSVVQQLVRLGIAAKVFSIGQQLTCNHETYGKLVWDIIGIDHDTPANTEYTHSLTIQLHDCLSGLTAQFNPFNDNVWSSAAIRNQLNSDDETGFFVKGLDANFLATVGEVTKKTASYDGSSVATSTEKFFLLSNTEVNDQVKAVEGDAYAYYTDTSVSINTKRIKNNDGAAQIWWLRSPYTQGRFAQTVNESGSRDYGGVTAKLGVAPACCIV